MDNKYVLSIFALLPIFAFTLLSSIIRERYFGPEKPSDNMVVERFETPWSRTDRYAFINFAFSKDTSYTETNETDLMSFASKIR